MVATNLTRIATEFLTRVCNGRVDEAYAELVAPGFVHHNAYFRGDADALRAGMAQDLAQHPDKALTIHRTLEDGSLVAVHSHVRHTPDAPGYALVHIFRIEAGRIVELWDISQEVPADVVNENGMF
jgi:predicted SnoaL-like aldol condensation-catalyzing enzyme